MPPGTARTQALETGPPDLSPGNAQAWHWPCDRRAGPWTPPGSAPSFVKQEPLHLRQSWHREKGEMYAASRTTKGCFWNYPEWVWETPHGTQVRGLSLVDVIKINTSQAFHKVQQSHIRFLFCLLMCNRRETSHRSLRPVTLLCSGGLSTSGTLCHHFFFLDEAHQSVEGLVRKGLLTPWLQE